MVILSLQVHMVKQFISLQVVFMFQVAATMLAQTVQTAAVSWKLYTVHHQKVMKGMCSGYLASSLKYKIERTECF